MTTIEERAPLDHTISEIRRLMDSIAGRLDRIAAELDGLPPRTPVDMLAVDLGAPTGGRAVVATLPVGEVPVDGSVEVRPVSGGGRFGPWVRPVGEQTAIGGQGYRTLCIDGLVEPFTWHRDMCVQVRAFVPVDEDLVEARHRAGNGGL